MATFSFVFIILLELLFLDGNRISSHQVTGPVKIYAQNCLQAPAE